MTLPGPRILVDYTSDKARIADALKTIPAGAAPSWLASEIQVAVSEAFAIERGQSGIYAGVFARECGRYSGPDALSCAMELDMVTRRTRNEARNRTAQFVTGLQGLLQGMASLDVPKLVIVFSEGFAYQEAMTDMLVCGPAAASARAVIYAMRLDSSMFDASVTRRRPVPIGTAAEERQAAISSLEALAGAARGAAFEIIGSTPANTAMNRM